MLGKQEQRSLLRHQPRGRAVGAAPQAPSFLQSFFLSLHFAFSTPPPANSHRFPSPAQPHPLIPRGGSISAPGEGEVQRKVVDGTREWFGFLSQGSQEDEPGLRCAGCMG